MSSRALAPCLFALWALVGGACGGPSQHTEAATPPAPAAPRAPESKAEMPEPLPSLTVPGLAQALERITDEGLRADVEALASDAFEGRAPGTPGETKTLTFLSEAFRVLGLVGAGDGGGYTSKVPLLGARSQAEARFVVGKKSVVARVPDDFVAHSRTGKPDVSFADVPVVFAGYGVVAPEYGWDDFKGLDLHGKLLVVLAGDPPVALPGTPEKLDDLTFGGARLTYYGRWTYKYEIASERGALGVLIVHDTAAAGYPYDVVKSGAEKEQLMLADDPGAATRVQVEGWTSEPFARSLFALAGKDFDALKARAATRDARPVALEALASMRVRSSLRRFDSHNAIAMLEGKDPALAGEAVILTAHWDHFGSDPGHEGDGIFNGAIDNASGVASMLAIARALAALPERPRRSVLFLSPTAEESGLLGARHYVNHPALPLARTVANVNMDCMNLWGPARTLVSVGLGTSTLDEVLEQEAAREGRKVTGDLEPEKGYFFRSDHLELMRRGVPALHFLHPGADYEGMSAEQGLALRRAYVTSTYHKVSDEALPTLRYDGARQDAQLLTRVVLDIANTSTRPTFKPGSGFGGR